jgi:hypothetical protein
MAKPKSTEMYWPPVEWYSYQISCKLVIDSKAMEDTIKDSEIKSRMETKTAVDSNIMVRKTKCHKLK